MNLPKIFSSGHSQFYDRRPDGVNLLICLQSSYHGQLNRVLADIFNPESLTHFRDRVELEEIIEDKVNNSQ